MFKTGRYLIEWRTECSKCVITAAYRVFPGKYMHQAFLKKKFVDMIKQLPSVRPLHGTPFDWPSVFPRRNSFCAEDVPLCRNCNIFCFKHATVFQLFSCKNHPLKDIKHFCYWSLWNNICLSSVRSIPKLGTKTEWGTCYGQRAL